MSNCFLAYPSEAFRDTANNFIIPVDTTSATPVVMFTLDSTPPTLVEFSSFDLDAGLLTLSFSETVRVSTVMFDALSLDQFPTASANRYTLTDGQILGSDRDVITIQLTTADLNGFKETGGVCFDVNSCWVRFTSSFIQDITLNSIVAVPTGSINVLHLVQDFVPDTTSPELVAFDLDLNRGEMNLVFDEPIRSTEIDSNLNQLTLANSSNGQTLFNFDRRNQSNCS